MRPDQRPGVVKLGGSLVADRNRLRAWLGHLAQGGAGACVVVPGGGPFADAVRQAQGALAFDEALAHRLALDAMGHMAEVFRALEPRLTVARDPDAALAGGKIPVWDPATLRGGHPEIPESWAVTSDSLAVWLATQLHAPRCLLVKSADGPPGATPSDLARLGLVDAAFPNFAAAYPGEIVIRGPAFALKEAA